MVAWSILGGGTCCLGGVGCFLGVKKKLNQGGVRRFPRTGPLVGVKVLDFSQMVSAPFGSRMLADLGAEVIKVECLTQPDSCRGLGPSPALGMASMFMSANMGKRSIVLDLKKDGAIQIIHKLVSSADIVLQNFRPGAAERMGIGFEDLKKFKQDIIYLNVSGFGRSGPLHNFCVYDPVIQCQSGLCDYQKDEFGPKLLGQVIFDKATAITAAQAMVAALVARDRGVGGQMIDLTMMDAALQFIWPDVYANLSWEGPAHDQEPLPGIFYHMWNTKDCVGGLALAIGTEDEWRNFGRFFGKPGLADDLRFNTASKRARNIADWIKEVQGLLNQLGLDEALLLAQSAGVPACRGKTPEETFADPQLAVNGTLAKSNHLLFGDFTMPRFPAAFLGTPLSEPTAPGFLGEQTMKILGEAGYSASEVEAFLTSGSALSTKAILLQKEGPKSKKAIAFGILDRLQKTAPNLWAVQKAPLLAEPSDEDAKMIRRKGPLAGIKVLELSRGIAGAFAGAFLGDQGAEVTKLEFAAEPGWLRVTGPATVEGMSSVHMAVNRNKRSLLLDFSKEQAKTVLWELVLRADVVLDDFHTGEVERLLGLSAAKALKANSQLIYVSLTGYGAKGPCINESSAEELLQARSGMPVSCPARDEHQTPALCQQQVVGKVSGMFMAVSATTALWARLRGAGGQMVTLSKLDCITFFNAIEITMNNIWSKINPNPPAPGKVPKFPALSTIYKLVDCVDKPQAMCYFAVSDKEFKAAAKALDQPHWLEKKEWATVPGRMKDLSNVFKELSKATADKTLEDAIRRCREYEIAHAQVLTPEEVLEGDQAAAMGAVQLASKPGVGDYKLWRHAAQFSASPASSTQSPAPLRGEGGKESLKQLGGFTPSRIQYLVQAGVVLIPDPPQKLQRPAAPVIMHAPSVLLGAVSPVRKEVLLSALANPAWPASMTQEKNEEASLRKQLSSGMIVAV